MERLGVAWRCLVSQALAKQDIEPISKLAQYSETELDAGLLAMATLGGSRRASAHLKSAGLEIPASTLRNWKHDYPRRFAAIAEAHGPEIERAVITLARDAALNAGMGVSEAIDLERDRMALDDGKAIKDASASAQRLSVAMGVQVDKMLVLQGRPQQITEHRRDAAETFEEIADRFPGLFTNGTATEEPDADQDIEDAHIEEENPRQEGNSEAQPQQEA